jgi:hypothetical protein
MWAVFAVNSLKVEVRFWRRSLSSHSSPPIAKTSSWVWPFMHCKSAIRVARVFSHSPSHGGSSSWRMVELINACAAQTGLRISTSHCPTSSGRLQVDSLDSRWTPGKITKNHRIGQDSMWTPGELQVNSFFDEIWQESRVNKDSRWTPGGLQVDSLLFDEGKV